LCMCVGFIVARVFVYSLHHRYILR
jgi:hypothetical protein